MRWTTKHRLTATTALLILLILGVLGVKLSPLLTSRDVIILPASSCNPGEIVCPVVLPQGATLTLSIKPRPILALQKLELEVHISGMKPDNVEIDFDGTQMKMGYNRFRLQGREGHFSGQGMLPVCVTGSMEWAATVLITAEGRTIAQPFHFQVEGR